MFSALTKFAGQMTGRVKREFSVESHPYTELVLYEGSLDDINQLEQYAISVNEDFSFGLVSITVAISFGITLLTVDVPPGKLFQFFSILTILGVVGTLYFSIKWGRGKRSLKSIIKRIKERPGPLGEEGKEIDSQQLEDLAPAEADEP